MRIAISSGHGLYVRGASGILDEVDEARRVVNRLAELLINRDVDVMVFHDDISETQSENLDRIVSWHNNQDRDFDLSVHFNAFEQREEPVGTECLYLTQREIAERISAAVAEVGFINRGAKQNSGLAFLNGTDMPSCLAEICFVDSEADAEIYNEQFENICRNLADLVIDLPAPIPEPTPDEDVLFWAKGPCSYFGGPNDEGVDEDEGLAFFEPDDIETSPHLFLAVQPEDTSGLARRLNPFVSYIACRWDYSYTPKEMLKSMHVAKVTALKTGKSMLAFPADWGPNDSTGRVADLSPSLMLALGIETDDDVEVIYPWRGE